MSNITSGIARKREYPSSDMATISKVIETSWPRDLNQAKRRRMQDTQTQYHRSIFIDNPIKETQNLDILEDSEDAIWANNDEDLVAELEVGTTFQQLFIVTLIVC